MNKQSISTLSTKRVLISISIFIAIPILSHIINLVVQQYDLSLMLMLNLGAAVLIIYNWNLFGIHYNRVKYNLRESLFYILFSTVAITLWTFIGTRLLHCVIIMPSASVFEEYPYAALAMLIAYSFSEASILNISWKCATDHWKIRHRELEIILLSGITFGILMTVLFLPSLNFLTIITTLLYNVVLCMFLFYLYNQTNSFVPGLTGFAISNFIFMLVSILL